MHSKTPSAPVLPGAITADQKKKKKPERERREREREKRKKSMITAVAKQNPRKEEEEKVRDKLDTRNYSLKRSKGKYLLSGIVRKTGCHPAWK